MINQPVILVIDDQIGICHSIEKVLGRKGYRVESYLSGGEALERIKAGGVDLIISDLMMPERTGLDVLKDMHATGITTPLVVITGYGSIGNSLESLCLGAVDYLPKPFTMDELGTAVSRGLRAARIDPGTLPVPPRGTFEIRHHTWVRRTDGQEVLVGVHPFKLKCCGTVRELDLANDGDELIQGCFCGKLVTGDEPVPALLWSPISGVVKAVNRQAVEDPALMAADPYGKGWLMRITPFDFEENLKALVEV